MDVFKLNPLQHVSLRGYIFDCWCLSSGTILDTLQDKQTFDDFIEAKRGDICGIKGDRLINTSESNKTIWYIEANNLYNWVMVQKLPCKDFKYYITSQDDTLNTPDDIDYSYYIVCDIDYNDDRKDKTEQISLMPNKRKINDN